MTYRPETDIESRRDRPANHTGDAIELADSILRGLREANPNALVQGEADYVLIDGRFDLVAVAKELLAAQRP